MAKRGPNTKQGRAAVRLNAVNHGVLCTTPVIPEVEREEDWQAHRSGVLASLAPEGHLETTLADRAALLLWRLARIARYECASIGSAQKTILEDALRMVQICPSELLSRPDHLARECQRLHGVRLLPDEHELGKLIRYEAHLHRQLLQTLHELEAIQARRQGLHAPLARVDVQGLPEE